MNIDLQSQSLGECLKEVNNFGHTKLINICDGSFSVVPCGSVDWFLIGLLIFCFLGLIGMFIFLVFND